MCGVLAILLHRSELDDLSSAGYKILQLLLVFRRFRSWSGFDEFGEVGQYRRINGVCFGAAPCT